MIFIMFIIHIVNYGLVLQVNGHHLLVHINFFFVLCLTRSVLLWS
jgi:hypothetical protein